MEGRLETSRFQVISNNLYLLYHNRPVGQYLLCQWQRNSIISPLLVNVKFITNFLDLFNEFLSELYQPLRNNSTLPKSNTCHTEKNRLSDIIFDDKKKLQIIQSLDTNKAHGYNDISVRILKLSSPSIIKLLSIKFQNFLKFSIFLDDWRKGNIVTVHKKNPYTISKCICSYVQKNLRSSFWTVSLISRYKTIS